MEGQESEMKSHAAHEENLPLRLSVRFRSQTITVPYSDEDSVGTIKEKISSLTGVLPEFMKLVVKGKILGGDDAILSSVWAGEKAGRVNMIGSRAEELLPSAPPAGIGRVKDDLSDAGKASSLLKRAGDMKFSRRMNSEFSFGRIETLPGFSDQYKSEEILRSLANDQAILAVLAKHKWKVGSLCEMFPEGYVGVSNVCVMGLNQNHGEKILLRLRTDDLKGFRKPLSIRKVLYHELAHNVFSEHDDNFNMLMRQIEREVNEEDWANSGKGRTLDSSYERYQGSSTVTSSSNSAAPQSFRLGGDEGRASLLQPRNAAALAALARHSAEEKEVEDSCGMSQDNGSGAS